MLALEFFYCKQIIKLSRVENKRRIIGSRGHGVSRFISLEERAIVQDG